MARQALIIGFLLVSIGVGGYLAARPVLPTALLPAAFGLLLVLSGLIATKNPAATKHAMHIAALVSLLGTCSGLFMGVQNTAKRLSGNQEITLIRATSPMLLGVLSLIFLVLCIRSFKSARLSEKA